MTCNGILMAEFLCWVLIKDISMIKWVVIKVLKWKILETNPLLYLLNYNDNFDINNIAFVEIFINFQNKLPNIQINSMECKYFI